MGRNLKYYGIRFDGRSYDHNIDRRRSQKIEHDSIFCDHLRAGSQTIVKACFHMIAELFAICDPIDKFKARCINEEEILHQPSLDPELLSKHAIFTSLFPHLAQITQVFIFPSLHL